MSTAPKRSKQQGLSAFVRRRPRFNACALLFVLLIGGCCATGIGPARAILLAFVAAAIVFLALIAHMFSRADTASMRSRAREEDQGRWGALWSSVVVSGVVLVALGLELHASHSGGALEIALAAATLLLSWLFMNTMFAIHYAHAFYGDDAHKRKRGGLQFPGEGDPDYWDFAYFAIVIGMTFQVSDVQVCDRRLRRIVLVHGAIAFFFNVIIIAISVNVVAGKA
ncbi:MAG: DUF1345 domain-containing protein [Dokdonella sp.]